MKAAVHRTHARASSLLSRSSAVPMAPLTSNGTCRSHGTFTGVPAGTFHMKIFHCDHCEALVFFESVQCVSCGHSLAFLPDVGAMASLEQSDDGLWRTPLRPDGAYRLCNNYAQQGVCNWAVAADDPQALCVSCRLTTVIPDIDQPSQRTNWQKLELAKRRLMFSLLELHLPVAPKSVDPDHGLAFEFRTPSSDPDAAPVLTGHADGVITLNADEADDAEREKRRLQLHEPYRTVLGHFRHEIGHYYWDRLIRDGTRLEGFRALFGDEQQDYAEALKRHYEQGPPADWQQHFVSAYGSAHPWEDWAETWAHYLHMSDTLQTAVGSGMMLKPRRRDEPSLNTRTHEPDDFDRMISDWFALTYMLNNLNRGMGLADAYPFVLSTPAIEKLRFVHEVVRAEPQASPVAQVA